MTQCSIKILTKDYFNVTSQRGNDKRIMKECQKLDLSKGEITQINTCRLFLQVLHLNDISAPGGKGENQKFPRQATNGPLN